ncbi:MAG: ribosome maturation factor RimM [Flavobacteriales bacterium]
MEFKKEELHALGYFSKLHGYKGELTAALDTADQKDYEGLKTIFVDVKGQLIPYFIELLETKTNTSVKVKLEGIDTENAAKQLVKCSIYIQPEFISEADNEKLSMRAIAGYKVIDEKLGHVGVVDHIEESPVNPLLVIRTETKEILLPLHEDFFQKIDRRKKQVHIAAPDGLIEFYLES